MPYKRQGTENWWISFVDPHTGRQVKRSAGPDFKEAEALELELRAQSRRDKSRRRSDTVLDAVLAEYLVAHNTPQARSTVKHLLTLATGWARDLTTAQVRAHIKARQAEGASPGTINKEIVFLSAAINAWNLDHSDDLPNPTKGLKLKEPEGRLRWLTRDEYAQLLDHAEGHLRSVIILAINTGMRRGELFSLTWNQVDLTHRMITLDAKQTKSGKGRAIPINAAALAELESMTDRKGKIFPVKEVKRSFATACRNAGLQDVTLHTLRHTFASWLVQAGVPIYEVAKLMGHSSVTMTARYGHLAPGNLRSAVETLAA